MLWAALGKSGLSFSKRNDFIESHNQLPPICLTEQDGTSREPLSFAFLEGRPLRKTLPSAAPPRGRQLQREPATLVAPVATATAAHSKNYRTEGTEGGNLSDRRAPRDVVASSTSTWSRKRRRVAPQPTTPVGATLL